MSRSGNCYDNAAMESFFHSFKGECIQLLGYISTLESPQKRVNIILEVEQARGDCQKAEQKIASARVDFEVASARLRTLEEELARLQGNSKGK
jgi:transposase InsO family protein